MDPKIIQKISSRIYQQYPEVSGAAPKLRALSADQHLKNYVLTYQARVKTASGTSLARTIRVTVNDHGKIIKITTSH